MSKTLQILYIEDNPDDVMLTRRMLSKAKLDYKMYVVESEQHFITALESVRPDLILADHSLPGFNSREAFDIVQRKRPGTPFILLTGTVSEQFAVDSLLAGIDDYILKTNLIRLPSSIDRVLSKKKITQEKETIEILHHELQKAYGEIEAKNKEITDSLNYAQRIQKAVLPREDQFSEEFRSGFVIYSPRDIVSGDLYWLANTTTTDDHRLRLKIVAAMDCTGHGVPGAFMSLLVSGLLNQTLKNNDINSPGDVLAFLNNRLPDSLNKNHAEFISDGLDMSLCAIDVPASTVYFSGANRPLWIVRKEGSSYRVDEYKGTKASIGAHTPAGQVFDTLKINVAKGERLFLFTDGITDQFGGLAGKKLGRQKLKELLVLSAHLPMRYQREYLCAFFKEWKGELEQVDDMLVIGIEMD